MINDLFLPAKIDVERRNDGTLVLRSPEPLRPYRRCLGEYLESWAERTPNAVFLAQRESGGGWRKVTYADVRRRVRAIASYLLRRDLTTSRPVAILSDNSIEHALMTFGAMHAGIPAAPISPAYSLMSRDYVKLRAIFELLQPGLVFADDAVKYAGAVEALSKYPFEFVTARNMDGAVRAVTPFSSLLETEDTRAVDRTFQAIGPDTVGKFLLTSGSTGHPKAVINTQRMMCSNQQSMAQLWPLLEEEDRPVLVEWLPWNHTFGGNNNLNSVLRNGGTYYIDEGKPLPGLIETTVRNLREVSPTIYFNVPRGYDLLIPYLENDETLRRTFFARLKVLMYAAAALPLSLSERLDRLAVAERGTGSVPLLSGWGSTETAPMATMVHFKPVRPSVIGLPGPGIELKMVPLAEDNKYELRVRGPNVTPGYLKRPDLTEAAFDDEGFYKIGDAGRFADPEDPAKGIEFAGRLVEDFKLMSGVWVYVGAFRVAAIEALVPLAHDVVIAGEAHEEVGLLIFPSPAIRERLNDPALRGEIRNGLQRLRSSSACLSTHATRALVLTEPPSIDAGEITDKGYINQRAVLARRAELVERLYQDVPPPDVILL